jgi:hypothetical protein
MNDTELDQLLNTWSVPPVPASLRASVRAGFAALPERKRLRWPRKFQFAATILCGVTFLLAVALAFPQTLRLVSPTVRAPYIVDSDVLQYAGDGTSSVELHLRSYNSNGSEIIVHQVATSFLKEIRLSLRAVRDGVGRLTLPLVVSSELLERDKTIARVNVGPSLERYRLGSAGSAAALINTGCVYGPVVGHETILDYPTVAVRHNMDDWRRMTLWMAPDLGCFALRITIEERGTGGTFGLVLRKQALKVTLNP